MTAEPDGDFVREKLSHDANRAMRFLCEAEEILSQQQTLMAHFLTLRKVYFREVETLERLLKEHDEAVTEVL